MIMITSRSEQKRLVEKQIVDNIHVIYIRNKYSNDMGIVSRFYSFLRFVLLSTIQSLRIERIDLLIATSTPLTVGIPALVLRSLRRTKFLFEVRDLWPEAPIQLGGLKNRTLRRIALSLEKRIYVRAEHIIALSPGMRDGVLARNIPSDKVSMIPNMSKVDRFYPRDPNLDIADKYSIDTSKFNCIYFGALGLTNGIEYIVKAAKSLSNKGNKKINILFVGAGSMARWLEEIKKQPDIYNIQYLGPLSMNVLSEVVNLCSVSLVTFKNIPILYTNSPNKLFDSLSAGKPVIVNSPGWTKKLVEEKECGAYVDPENSDELVKLLEDWSLAPDVIRRLGENARKLAETEYDKSILTKKFLTIVNQYV